MNYRVFCPSDEQGVVDLILPIQQQEFGVQVTLSDQPDLLDIPHFYQQGKGNFWVALDGEILVGSLGLKDIGEGDLVLRKMFVAPAYRGPSAVAAHLLTQALDWAKQQGAARIWLGTTDRYHAAHRFYAKHGFEPVAVDQLPAHFPRMAVDSLFFCQPLTA